MENSLKIIRKKILGEIIQNDTWKNKGYVFEYCKFKSEKNFRSFYYLEKFYKTKREFQKELKMQQFVFDKFFKDCLNRKLIKWDKKN